ncbi:hypothetical protein [Oceanobacillus damuensis]|uniref:hypothetical protein n=1 Tax=Oceanobacillus damuensis TaxID=937928 RepID=UPI00083059A4|nr:hypothetical protein [Oceanobacillus damuensis]
MLKEQKKMFIAYADEQRKNQFLVRKGRRYFLLNNRKEMRKLSPKEAYQIFLMITAKQLKFRGIGSFQTMKKGGIQ